MEEQHIQRVLDRLNSFSDAVVAIAATLLVLPLVDSASSIGDRSVGAFLSDVRPQLFAFVLSFVVVYRFWSIHHQVYSRLIGHSRSLVVVNGIWLLSIVFLPFPTELLGVAHSLDRPTIALYVGSMCVTALAMLTSEWIAAHSGLLTEQGRTDTRLADSAIATGLMLLALVVAVTVPAIGLYALLLLFLTRPVERLLDARRRATTPDPTAGPADSDRDAGLPGQDVAQHGAGLDPGDPR